MVSQLKFETSISQTYVTANFLSTLASRRLSWRESFPLYCNAFVFT